MYIDIKGNPPADILREKKRYLKISLSLLGIALFAILLAVVRVVFDSGYDTQLENTAIVLFVAAGFVFVYFAEKLNEHKPLSKEKKEKVEELRQQHTDIELYCRKVADLNRELIDAEYDAITAHVDALKGQKIDG